MTGAECSPPPWAWFWMGRRRSRSGRRHGGGPPSWVFEMLGNRQGRAERGEVRYLILDAIRDKPRHGYEIIQVIEERTGGGYRPSPGTVYPTLQLLEEMGHARSRDEEGRRVYEISEAGLADLEAHRDDVDDAYERLGRDDWFEGPEIHELFRRFGRLMRVLGRAFKRGKLGPQQLRAIREIIDDAIDRVEHVVRSSGGGPSQGPHRKV